MGVSKIGETEGGVCVCVWMCVGGGAGGGGSSPSVVVTEVSSPAALLGIRPAAEERNTEIHPFTAH